MKYIALLRGINISGISIKYSILLLHLKECSNMKMLVAPGWCEV